MASKQNSAAVVLVVLLAIASYGVYYTGRAETRPRTKRVATTDSTTVDQSSLMTAEALVLMPATIDERPFAEDALRIGDQEMDLSFADAVRTTVMKPHEVSTEAQAAATRLRQAEKELATDQAEVASLTSAAATATGSAAVALGDRLNLEKAHVALHQDEADDARQDLMQLGGDPQGRIQAMIAAHEASSRHSDSTRITIVPSIDARGLVHHAEAWWDLRSKAERLARAKDTADSAATTYAERHKAMESRETPAGALAEGPAAPVAGRRDDTANARKEHDSSTALLRSTQMRAVDSKERAALDQHADNQRNLSGVYAEWIDVIGVQKNAVVNRMLRAIALILFIAFIGLVIDRLIEGVLTTMPIDRRRLQTLCMVTRVSLQILCAILIVLVIFGPPNNLGTFLGLAGAGLTVALKDFIIGFIGWFVLMGKDGIRIGDMVEINGVTGEVVEIGLFHTVLLETGDWSDSGHPTGRRVTFTNSFAIEGHYFNFSTSGQWLWDDIRIVVPAGRDPYAIADAIQKQMEEATAESARAAELHWKGARRAPNVGAITAAPAVHIKPIIGGTEITARYITHASERSQLRASLYRTAVDLLGDKATIKTEPEAAAGHR